MRRDGAVNLSALRNEFRGGRDGGEGTAESKVSPSFTRNLCSLILHGLDEDLEQLLSILVFA